jgi:ribosomal protein S18 acetylase RimI-like enzyme
MATNCQSVSIRLATLSDTTALTDLITAYLQFYNATPPSADQLEQLINTICTDKEKGYFVLAVIAEQSVGFATLYQIYSTFQAKPALILNDLFVLPEFRRLGIGKRLYTACKEMYAGGNYAYMEWMTAPSNATAINFYQDNGAKKTDWLVFKHE